MNDKLPIDDVLPDVVGAMRQHRRGVLQAPPGAGKTTRVPLALLQAGITGGRIVMLEPRRLAARAAAERLAAQLGEQVGETVGYRMRGAQAVSARTRIEVVTEGILTRQIQRDPGLEGVGAVIFDEFHERSLNADLGLALCLEIAEALREDLHVLVMSATLDAEPVARLMGGAPLITSQGRSYPVESVWLERPLPPRARFEEAFAQLVVAAAGAHKGGVLAFLPGEAEIRRVQGLLSQRLGAQDRVLPLYGALPFEQQQAAIAPLSPGQGRKVVLATSIAETSLTIEDVRVVVDGGLARRARFDAGTGMARLVTEKASRAEATQRAGRAGRVAQGHAYKLWAKGQEGAMPAFPPAEIEAADLSAFALDLAQWGAAPEDLPLLTLPPAGSFGAAREVLEMLGALDERGAITLHGKALARLPLHPRLGHMLLRAGGEAAPLVALLGERDPLARGAPVDIALRLEALRDPRGFCERRPYGVNRAVLERVRGEVRRLRALAKGGGGADDASPREALSVGQMVALAYPDRIAQRRSGQAPRYVMSGGSGAVLPEGDSFGSRGFLVVSDHDGNRREAQVRLAAALTLAEIRELYGDRIRWQKICEWNKRDNRVDARMRETLGSVVLEDRLWKDVPPEALAEGMLEGVRLLGFSFAPPERLFLARARLMETRCVEQQRAWPGFDDAVLMEEAESWLLPHLNGVKTAAAFRQHDLLPALRGRLSWEQMQALDREVPGHFLTPLGRKIAIDYSQEPPSISLRLQEMFGQTTHPCVAGRALKVVLLSPAGRPVQTTTDLPGFWQSSYADVRKDMRGQYPRHPWPEDPRDADPTLRAKSRRR